MLANAFCVLFSSLLYPPLQLQYSCCSLGLDEVIADLVAELYERGSPLCVLSSSRGFMGTLERRPRLKEGEAGRNNTYYSTAEYVGK